MSESDNFDFGSEDFESMLEESLNKKDDFFIGEELEGTILGLDNETIFVDISGKSEASLPIGEFFDSDGEVTVKKGDKIKVFVVAYDRGEIILTSEIGKSSVSTQLLQHAFNHRIAVLGTVNDEINGGFAVSVGTTRCFCPYSQMDIRRISSGDEFLNKHFKFEIIDFKNNGRNIVLSRRALLEDKQKEVIEKLKDKLNEGDIIEGTVNRIAEFGVFADLGGVNALIPRSELGRSRFITPDSFEVGSKVKGKIISLDWANNKIAISIKQTEADPGEKISSYSEGDELNGRVSNFIKAGAFVEIEPGLDGFIPLSRMSYTKRVHKPEDILSIGAEVKVKVVEVDSEKNRIGLELLTGEKNPWETSESEIKDAIQDVTIEFVKNAGLAIRMDNGMEGFIPARELLNSDGDINKNYKAGDKVKAATLEYDKERKKLILSEKIVLDREEKEEYKKYIKSDNNSVEESTENSSLGSMFKDVFSDIQKNIK